MGVGGGGFRRVVSSSHQQYNNQCMACNGLTLRVLESNGANGKGDCFYILAVGGRAEMNARARD